MKNEYDKQQEKKNKMTAEEKDPFDEMMTAAIEAVKKNLKEKRENYQANKDQLQVKAFEAIDISADGKVQQEELVAAFTIESDKNIQVLSALGLLSDSEAQA